MRKSTFLAAVACAAACAKELPLEASRWKLVLLVAAPSATALISSIGQCGAEPCLSVGPWRAGRFSARYEFNEAVPLPQGAVEGRYRTVGLYPKQAVVRLHWYQGERPVREQYFELPASAEWSNFSAPLVRIPEGADRFRVAFGLAEQTEGSVQFARLRIASEPRPVAYPTHHPLRRPIPPSTQPASKYPRAEKHGGAWWLIAPDGKPFFSLGSTMPSPGRSQTGGFERNVLTHMRRLGLNSVAGGSNLQRWSTFNNLLTSQGERPLWQFKIIEIRVSDAYDTLVGSSGKNPGTSQAEAAKVGGFNHAWADPFDPRWEADVRKQVRDGAALVGGKHYFVGWFAGNERSHAELHRYVWSPGCAANFEKFLSGKYGAISDLNKAWGSSYESFADLIAKRPDPVVRHGAMYEDFVAFSRVVLRRLNDIMIRAVREEDPGRLIISNRFTVHTQRDVLNNLDLYRGFDIIAVNLYPQNMAPGISLDERQFLEEVHRKTGKPVLIGEWSVPARDSGLYSNPKRLDWSYRQTVGTQSERARQAAQTLADFYNLPFVVGAHWFTWNDFDSPTRQANRGLFKSTGEPWTEVQDALKRLIDRIPAH